MSIYTKLPPLPTRAEIAQQIKYLLSQVDSHESVEARESVATWAQKWIISDGTGMEYPIPDMKVWEMLDVLAGADMKDSPDSYLHGRADFEDWLDEIGTGTGSAGLLANE